MKIKHILQTVQTVSHTLTQRTSPTTLSTQTHAASGLAIRTGVRAGNGNILQVPVHVPVDIFGSTLGG